MKTPKTQKESDELAGLSATTLARLISTRQCTSEQVVQAHLERAHTLGHEHAAFVTVDADQALARARELDRLESEALAAMGPLAGVPFTVKDWLGVAGLPVGTSFGGSRVADSDATAVSRMRDAGAIPLGKTRAAGPEDREPGPFNPRDRGRLPGASSSGEACVVAAGISPIGIASDSGGSIRWPAHCCGVTGLKPTQGRVPVTGHVPPVIALSDPRTVVGPIARHVEDIALVTHIISGTDGKDASAIPVPNSQWQPAGARDLRVAVFDTLTEFPADAATRTAVGNTADLLANAGARVAETSVPLIETAFAITLKYWARPESTSLHRWAPPHTSTLSADEVEESLFDWDRLRRSFTEFMSHWDLILCPVAATAAPAIREVRASDYGYTVPFSLSGQPALSLPAGHDTQSHPINVQLVGRPFEEHRLFDAGALIEAAFRN